MTTPVVRKQCIDLVDEAVKSGARQTAACDMLGISERTLQRWKDEPEKCDMRKGPNTKPINHLTEDERKLIIETANSPEFRDKSPSQIVPLLLDKGFFIASESSFYRILKEDRMISHRQKSRTKKHKKPHEYKATAPNQIWSWDITYMFSPVRGIYYYLYMIIDVFSRLIIHWEVHEKESADIAANFFAIAYQLHGVKKDQLILHSDNGAAMKGLTMLVKMQTLGVIPSFSRPRVSDDNPYSEALFKTLKYCPEYPFQPFTGIEAARIWVGNFTNWYNYEHLHSGINYVTPGSKHKGDDIKILENRKKVLEEAKHNNPLRWIRGEVRNCNSISTVILNPGRDPKELHNELKKSG